MRHFFEFAIQLRQFSIELIITEFLLKLGLLHVGRLSIQLGLLLKTRYYFVVVRGSSDRVLPRTLELTEGVTCLLTALVHGLKSVEVTS